MIYKCRNSTYYPQATIPTYQEITADDPTHTQGQSIIPARSEYLETAGLFSAKAWSHSLKLSHREPHKEPTGNITRRIDASNCLVITIPCGRLHVRFVIEGSTTSQPKRRTPHRTTLSDSLGDRRLRTGNSVMTWKVVILQLEIGSGYRPPFCLSSFSPFNPSSQ